MTDVAQPIVPGGIGPDEAAPKKRTRRRKESKPRAPRTLQSHIVILGHDADHDMYHKVTAPGGDLAKFANVRLAVKCIRENLSDGTYEIVRVLGKKTKTTETIKKSIVK